MNKALFHFKNGLLFPAPSIQCWKSEGIAGSFHHCIGDGGGEVTMQKTVDWSPRRREEKKWNEIETSTIYLPDISVWKTNLLRGLKENEWKKYKMTVTYKTDGHNTQTAVTNLTKQRML